MMIIKWWREWVWSRIILSQESVALCKYLKTLWLHHASFWFGVMRSPEVCGGYDDNKRVEGVGVELNHNTARERGPL
jgi:hypothetical protein